MQHKYNVNINVPNISWDILIKKLLFLCNSQLNLNAFKFGNSNPIPL